MEIYIGNFDTQWTSENLKKLFESYGSVDTATVAMDAFTDRSRGFGYVSMANETEAENAISSLDRMEVNGRTLSVLKAEPREERRGSYKIGSSSVNPYRFKKN